MFQKINNSSKYNTSFSILVSLKQEQSESFESISSVTAEDGQVKMDNKINGT